MNPKQACQIVLLILTITSFLRMVYIDCNGRPEEKPKGFFGVMCSIIAALTFTALHYGAGALSTFFGE